MRSILIIILVLVGIAFILWKAVEENRYSKMREHCENEHPQGGETCLGGKDKMYVSRDELDPSINPDEACITFVEICINNIKKEGFPEWKI